MIKNLIFDFFIHQQLPKYTVENITNTINNHAINTSKLTQTTLSNNYNLVKNVPEYLHFTPNFNFNAGLKTIKQYNGYLINLKEADSLKSYIQNQLSLRNQKAIKSKKNRLEKSHQIRYKTYYGGCEVEDLIVLFEEFHELLKVRFDYKKIYNRDLENWKVLTSVAIRGILSKNASLFVIFEANRPICLTLNFHRDSLVFSHIQTFDNNYAKYGLGDLNMSLMIKWCLENEVTMIDLSMGSTYYKKKWCNIEYSFHHHIIYDKNSFLNTSVAFISLAYYRILYWLRKHKVIGSFIRFDRLKYFLLRKRYLNS